MRAFLICAATLWLAAAPGAQADQTISSMQQTLKDQGFYYGEVTGTKDADTTAALRRYQIRNGLKVTGELNAETQKALGIRGTASPPRSTPTPPAVARTTPTPPSIAAAPDTSDLAEDYAPAPPAPQSPSAPGFPPNPPPDGLAPGQRSLYAAGGGLFAGTPYEAAPADVQRQVVIGAQSLLARQGYYRSVVDGEFGPGTAFALRAYQSRFRLLPSGRLDLETLAALGLLPAQRAAGINAPPGRVIRPRMRPGQGERIYIPR